jgi:ABC-type sugar transport system substrate-binding protein
MEPHGMTPKHPDIIVTLTGQDGNAFAVLGRCREAARNAGLSDGEIATFMAEATAGDYDHLLQAAMRWFEIR